ncbi:armadillo repeat-containing protein 8-like isoform X2 [Oppia nitens]|uniref:armadillo repeat-containing protein 8-like isoform X2 n=1 Tax=Oppia nitens TaxID=1686743 RepID=UPI0023DA9A75|nr:armadillo repeat-containing protein 8-like isoform X2 [Oppia nitens]
MANTLATFMEVDSTKDNYHGLYSEDPIQCLEALINIKNLVIGSNRMKGSIIESSVVPRLIQLIQMCNKQNSANLAKEAVLTIASLAKGTEEHVKVLIDSGVVAILLENTRSSDAAFVEACLRALRTILKSPETPVNMIFDRNDMKDDPLYQIIPHLLSLAASHRSFVNKECIANIMAASCQTNEQQNILNNYGSISLIASLLVNNVLKVQMAALHWLAQICYQNETVSAFVVNEYCDGKSMSDLLVSMMSQQKTHEMQLIAAKCMTCIYRSGALNSDDKRIIYKTLPTLVRMCKKDKETSIRAMGAETLAYLTEIDTNLQQTASICDHLIPTLADLLKYQSNCISLLGYSDAFNNQPITAATVRKLEQEVITTQDMKQAAFKAFASLGANDEDIRKRIIETDFLMDHIVSGLSDPNIKTRLSALRCLHSLSRSVQQLRTTFQDHAVWVPLRNLLHNASDEILSVASSTLCNLLLEFSPSKQHFLDRGAVELLCDLTRRDEAALRLNGVWALMNMAFQADQNCKSQILNALGTDQIFRLLSDPDVNTLMKTLGLLRNLLSNKPHIDHIMSLHGKQVMQAVILILEGDHQSDVKEQALCILANIADGDTAKEFIMSNEDMLKKLTSYMMHSNVKLQIAATFCISNLIWSEEEGANHRQDRLKEMGVHKLLQQLLTTNDTTLFDRVKTALQQFNN